MKAGPDTISETPSLQTGALILICPTTTELCASLHRLRAHRHTQSFAVTNTQRYAAVGGVCSVYTAILICIIAITPAWWEPNEQENM